MKVRLLFFASLAESLGRRSEERDVPDGSTPGSLWKILVDENPVLGRGPRPAFACNAGLVDPGAVLKDGDEVAFLPPVGGG